jgi:hypothetical protein
MQVGLVRIKELERSKFTALLMRLYHKLWSYLQMVLKIKLQNVIKFGIQWQKGKLGSYLTIAVYKREWMIQL